MADLQAEITKAKPAAAWLNAFGQKLMAQEAAAHPKSNIFISPLSLYLALAMTEGGAAGETRKAMRSALSVSPTASEPTLHNASSALMNVMRSLRGAEVTVANALWSDVHLPLAAEFIERSKQLYDAEARTLPFADPATTKAINGWVSEKTKTKIPEIVTEEIVRDAGAILTNAVYFAGKWKNEFYESQTKPQDFHLATGEKRKVPMMKQTSMRGAYRTGKNFEAAMLPYLGSSVAMYVLLPHKGVSPEHALEAADVKQLIEGNEPYTLDLSFPRFSTGYFAPLKDSLTALGMGIAFKYPGAEFEPLGSKLFYLSQVLHKTRLEVDEKGTVAAAATAVIVGVGMGAPQKQETKTLVFDRPFALMIVDSTTGCVLFSGAIYDPQ